MLVSLAAQAAESRHGSTPPTTLQADGQGGGGAVSGLALIIDALYARQSAEGLRAPGKPHHLSSCCGDPPSHSPPKRTLHLLKPPTSLPCTVMWQFRYGSMDTAVTIIGRGCISRVLISSVCEVLGRRECGRSGQCNITKAVCVSLGLESLMQLKSTEFCCRQYCVTRRLQKEALSSQ